MSGALAISQIEPLDDYRIRLRLTNRMTVVRDLSLLVRVGLLGEVTTPRRFRRARLVKDELPSGNSVSWRGQEMFDLSCDVLLWGKRRRPPGARSCFTPERLSR